jgi:pimeloyl-ACP methyl ester carboxylesterase
MNEAQRVLALPSPYAAGETQALEYRVFSPLACRENDVIPPHFPAGSLVFLHEGLGSVALWRDFPRQLCRATGCWGVAFSRYGHGRSTPRPADMPRPLDYLEREAWQTLPTFLAALRLSRPWLVGHSDGGSIALLAAMRHVAPLSAPLSGVILIAPHYFVEEVCLAGIRRAAKAYAAGDLRHKLARYHANPDTMFYGWHDTWLRPARRDWNLTPLLSGIDCPALALQGREDEYATLEQIEGIARHASGVALKIIEHCGHFPHLTHASETVSAITAFIGSDIGGAA